MKQMILKIDDDLAPEELPAAIMSQGQVIGTKSFYNKILILILTSSEPDELEELFECSVLAVEGEKLNQSKILSFMLDVDDEDVTDITGKLQTFAGRSWDY